MSALLPCRAAPEPSRSASHRDEPLGWREAAEKCGSPLAASLRLKLEPQQPKAAVDSSVSSLRTTESFTARNDPQPLPEDDATQEHSLRRGWQGEEGMSAAKHGFTEQENADRIAFPCRKQIGKAAEWPIPPGEAATQDNTNDSGEERHQGPSIVVPAKCALTQDEVCFRQRLVAFRYCSGARLQQVTEHVRNSTPRRVHVRAALAGTKQRQ